MPFLWDDFISLEKSPLISGLGATERLLVLALLLHGRSGWGAYVIAQEAAVHSPVPHFQHDASPSQ